MRGTGGEALVVIAGENFGDVAGRAIEREQGVGAQVGVGGVFVMIAIFADAGPAGEERPDRTVVVAAAAVARGAAGNDAHAPVGLVIGVGKLRDHGAGFFFVEHAEPHGDGG